jgi:competence protein ComEA
MSEAAPWRALEDDAAGRTAGGGSPPLGGSSGDAEGGRPTAGVLPRLVSAGGIAIAGLLVAAIAGIVAIWLVVSSGHGSVVVDGDGAVPGRSDRASGSLPIGSSGVGRAPLVVDVQGAVARPGIVELPAGARVADAIAAAGGYGPRVAADRVAQVLNLAAVVKDGDQVVVPSRDDRATAPTTGTGSGSAGGSAGGGAGAGAGGPIDLNHATIAELDALPGIGPVTAAKIVAARDEQPFGSVEDLRTRKILGAATFDKVKDLVTVR